MATQGVLTYPKGITHRTRPSIAQKLHAVQIATASSVHHAAQSLGYGERTVRRWVMEQDKLRNFSGSKARKRNTGNCEAVPIIPDGHDLVIHMKDLRRQDLAVTSSHMLQFLRADHTDWIENYKSTRKTGYKSLLRLLKHFADRHGFSKQRICRQKKTQEDLEATRLEFGRYFHDKYHGVAMDTLYNADETGIYVANSESHSYRMTALLTIRGDGAKLPIFLSSVARIELGTNCNDWYP
ncbi:hypothetical protein H257_09781 [Aphanomyces astaci]|uniref:HTH psq-type domain-containing protein n=1 Tax=Aphanomyces astaci TaxID=112090 RepID=W4GAJ5_APHAT|nr:hypothetical protein H257_09781 [Aphanomyces astaci]ETV76316.1 hypothetical protein H257_09781 [Aphanomyces astaci]|eukprot:XP_009834441.1 hypothetical protein H257_09781 [Aphanomyces astaci]